MIHAVAVLAHAAVSDLELCMILLPHWMQLNAAAVARVSSEYLLRGCLLMNEVALLVRSAELLNSEGAFARTLE